MQMLLLEADANTEARGLVASEMPEARHLKTLRDFDFERAPNFERRLD